MFLYGKYWSLVFQVQPALCDSENFSDWLKRLTLEAPEINVRHEACKGLYRLCLGRTMEGKKGYGYLLPLLGSLLSFLDDAQAMKPVRKEVRYISNLIYTCYKLAGNGCILDTVINFLKYQ